MTDYHDISPIEMMRCCKLLMDNASLDSYIQQVDEAAKYFVPDFLFYFPVWNDDNIDVRSRKSTLNKE